MYWLVHPSEWFLKYVIATASGIGKIKNTVLLFRMFFGELY